MKQLLLTFVASLYVLSVTAQPYAFNDAIKLRKYIDPTDGKFRYESYDSIEKILVQYLKPNEQIKMQFYSKNQLFVSLMDPVDRQNMGLDGDPLKQMQGAFSSIGGLDVTSLADGLARFLVKRTKEELSVAFFDKFRQQMTDPKYRDAVTLFPQTCNMLTDIGDNIYMYQTYLPALQEAFQQDLRMLTDHLPKVINDGNYAWFFNRHPLLKYTCLSGNYITNGILDEVHPGKIIENFPIEYIYNLKKETFEGYDRSAIQDVGASLELFQIVSTSFKAQNNSNYWVTAKEVRSAFSDQATIKIYLALIAKQGAHITFTSKTGRDSVITIFNKLATDFVNYQDEYAGFCTQLIAKGETVHNYILEAEELVKEKQTPSFELYYKYFNGVVDLFEQAGKLTDLPFIEDNALGGFDSSFNNYIRICRRTSDLALNLKERNYSTAIVDAYSIYSYAFSKPVVENETERKDKAVSDAKETLKRTQRFAPMLLRVGTFMASVAEAKNSQEVSDAIEAAALPAGSSRIKRESRGNIALNAYLGPFIGAERIRGVDEEYKFNSYGLLAPVGVSASLGRVRSIFSGKNTSSLSLFVSAIDLGAVAAFRFEDDETSEIPTITLRELIAPGAFIIYGFGKTPISFGAGWQIGPRLRNITATDKENSEMYSRFSLSFTVDIPLLNFATWPGNK